MDKNNPFDKPMTNMILSNYNVLYSVDFSPLSIILKFLADLWQKKIFVAKKNINTFLSIFS